MTTWTPDRVATLKKLHDERLSSSLIGAWLGVTRNSVIGKLHRLGLASGRAPSTRKLNRGGMRAAQLKGAAAMRRKTATFEGQAAHAAATQAGIQAAREAANALPDLDIPEAERLKLDDLEDHNCRWPYGDPKNAGFYFCGKPKIPGKSYCEFHALRSANLSQYTRGATRGSGNSKWIGAIGMISDPLARLYPVDSRTLEISEKETA